MIDFPALYKTEAPRVLATLIRLLGDFDVAEEALQEAFAAAVTQWPQAGVPAHPRAWLVSAGRFKGIDALRKRARPGSQVELSEAMGADLAGFSEHVHELQDDQLRLIFLCCHPLLPAEAQLALTLREVCGLTVDDIARAFLSTPATIAQRIVRGKAKLREAGLPYTVPALDELPRRLAAVLRVVYLIFNQGYDAPAGDSPARSELSQEALRLGRQLLELLPQAEVKGLAGLMTLLEARRAARFSADGDLVLLEHQDRRLWNPDAIAQGSRLADEALATGRGGFYAIQAAIAAAHAGAPAFEATDWRRITTLYDALLRVEPSPVVELNRAVAISMRDGPEAGLRLVEGLADSPALAGYAPYHTARAELLRRCGQNHPAAQAYRKALQLAGTDAERRFLQSRLATL